MSRFFLVAFVAMFVGACGGPVPSPPASASAPAAVGFSFPANTLVACDTDLPFELALLSAPGGAERGGDVAAATLRTFLARGQTPEMPFPLAGWRRVSEQAEASVLFVAPGLRDTPWVQVRVERAADGTWAETSWGACNLAVVFQEDAVAASWWLDPAAPAPGPDSRSIRALVVERSCAGGRAPLGRILQPVILPQPGAVLIAIGIRKAPGGQDCPGNPPFPIEIALPEPLGDRVLFDAGILPPRDARQPAP